MEPLEPVEVASAQQGEWVQQLDLLRPPGQSDDGDRYIDLCFTGSSFDISGPEAVRGPEQGSLTVQCHYNPGWKAYLKWWCRGADWGSCKILVQTNGSAFGVKERVSIRDDQTNHTFTVTMTELRPEDTDTYWCGIERTGTDRGFPVRVTIDPGKSTCMCVCVLSEPALPWSLRSLSSD
ncbi:CMRF35-like molecule 7 [Pipistrellus kuhlii]|uniref:CMRF35-like molecule 7 n=1 Tax=Pipistrellus kuhlii TaxID=59472 RepID=UPI00174F02B3|nr:CMRF35-like molecule 7 [Pipistrellus kuhlii]